MLMCEFDVLKRKKTAFHINQNTCSICTGHISSICVAGGEIRKMTIIILIFNLIILVINDNSDD